MLEVTLWLISRQATVRQSRPHSAVATPFIFFCSSTAYSSSRAPPHLCLHCAKPPSYQCERASGASRSRLSWICSMRDLSFILWKDDVWYLSLLHNLFTSTLPLNLNLFREYWYSTSPFERMNGKIPCLGNSIWVECDAPTNLLFQTDGFLCFML